MFESNLMARKAKKVLLDINFLNANVGDKFIVDSGPFSIPLTRAVVAGGSNADGVVNHPTYGKCYFFDGYCYFQNMAAVLPLAANNYKLVIEVAVNGGGQMCSFATGDYPAANNIKKGTELIHNQLGQPLQIFQTTDAGGYQRTYANGSANGQLVKLTVTEDNSNITLLTDQSAQVSIAPRYKTGGDSYLMLGTNHVLGTRLNGYLKSLKVVTI